MGRKKEVSVWIRAKDATGRVFTTVRRKLRNLGREAADVGRGILKMGAAFTAAAAGIGLLAKKGDEFLDIQMAFNRAVGGDGPAALQKLRDAAKGTVKDLDLMRQFNQALALGSAKTADEFANLIQLTQALGKAQGLDPTEALERANIAIARQSKLRADDLGITLDLAIANARYAKQLGVTAEKLSDAQKKEAFRVEFMRQAQIALEKLGGAEGQRARSIDQLTTSLGNLVDKMATVVANSDAVGRIATAIAEIGDDVVRILDGESDTIVEGFKALGSLAGNAFSVAILSAISEGIKGLDRMGEQFTRNWTIFDPDALRRWFTGGVGGHRTGGFDPTRDGTVFDGLIEQARRRMDNSRASLGFLGGIGNAEGAQRGAGSGGGAGGGGAAPDLTPEAQEDLSWIDKTLLEQRIKWLRSQIHNLPDPTQRLVGPTGDIMPTGQLGLVGETGSRILRARMGIHPMSANTFQLHQFDGLGGPMENIDVAGKHLEKTGAELRSAGEEAEKLGGIAVTGMAGIVEANIRGYDNIAQIATSTLSRIAQQIGGPGLLGAALGAGVSLIGSFFTKKDRSPVPVKIEDHSDSALQKWKRVNVDPKPMSVTIQVHDSQGNIEETQINLADREARDAIPRLTSSPRAG